MIQQIVVDNIIKVSSNKIYAGEHWRKRAKMKEDYFWITKVPFKKLAPIKEKVNLDFVFYFSGRLLDSSNCSYAAKILEDCLVAHGVLKDDTTKQIGRVSLESRKSEEKKADWCLIEISSYANR